MKPTLQISLPITSRGNYDSTRVFKVFADSFACTASQMMNYRIYLGVDQDDPHRSELLMVEEELSELEGVTVSTVLLSNYGHKICRIWETLAMHGYADGCDCYLLAGDDLKFITPWWDIKLSLPLLERGYGVEAFNDLAFPNFPTFAVLHRAHFDCFSRLFPDAFEDANQAGDPFLFDLYVSVGAARLQENVLCRNTIGGLESSRYTKTQPRAFRLSDESEQLRKWIHEREVYR